ncbi:DUF2786 domain-containing protein [Nocardioides daphniae]|uniref:DUF2786 domain-containing protein n=1 Tax=Nocardioides daphniae TaxID=402297 RepID=A0A4P7UFA2_9ACTN|nr:DUF2786 domain-containing protein [Nocardioides daphniae]QCC77988.1 DUF2786 domain-containing protein [Nocardioides daphniae]GGD23272.1 hypothetical protein GCM10007231_22950 [Nocardioides daphniae]
MTTHTTAALAKVRKLLAKAEDPAATPAEAEIYTAKAAQLIADHGIDVALLAADDPGSDRVADRVVHMDAPYAREKAQLLSTVAVGLRCRAVLRTRAPFDAPREHSVHLFGHESDLERADLLFTSLLLQSTGRLGRTPVPHGEHQAAFRRSWLAGFRISIAERLRRSEEEAERRAEARSAPTGRSTSLVLADRSREVDHAVAEQYPQLRTARPSSLSGSGMQAGYEAGARADLGGARLRGTPQALASDQRLGA